MKVNNKNKRSGMAILVVLCLSMVILMLGMAYMKSYTDSNPVTKLQLDRIQSDFFARGIQNIALFKIKKYPDFFIRSYRQEMYRRRVVTEGLPNLDPDQIYLPTPFESFMGRDPMSGDYGGVLNNWNNSSFASPLNIATYSTEISILSSKDFTQDLLEIRVSVQMQDKPNINTFKTSIATARVPR
jgi:hypothetical protein